jgi:hypothetical protein
MMIKASKFAIAIAAVASLAIATVEESSAAPVAVGANPVIAPAASEVVYRGYGPYTYRPAYTYQGYTYWYPSYGNWVYPGDYYYYNWW